MQRRNQREWSWQSTKLKTAASRHKTVANECIKYNHRFRLSRLLHCRANTFASVMNQRTNDDVTDAHTASAYCCDAMHSEAVLQNV